jgi:hypothetical protein
LHKFSVAIVTCILQVRLADCLSEKKRSLTYSRIGIYSAVHGTSCYDF